MQKTSSIVGGNIDLATQLAADPAQFDRFVEWTKTTKEVSSPVTMDVIELWLLMKDASKSELRELAPMVKDAYNYIVTHPQPYETLVSFDIQSDCE